MNTPSHILFAAILPLLLLLFPATAQSAAPAPGDFDGSYRLSAADFSLRNNLYARYFTSEFHFSIATSFSTNTATDEIYPTIMVNDFLYDGLIGNTEYDADSGVLTLKLVTLKPITTWFAIAPEEGGYTGMSAATANYLKFKINDDGTISIPDFSVGPYSASGLTSKIATWAGITVTRDDDSSDAGDDSGESDSFEGSYCFRTTMTEYPVEGISDVAATTDNYLLKFTINAHNQVWEFDGYTQDDIYLNSLRNLGTVKGDTFTLDMDNTNGIEWSNFVDETGEVISSTALLFGGRPGTSWAQGRTAFTLTRTSDGGFTLSPVSIFIRHTIQEEGEEGILNDIRKVDLLRSWTDPVYIGSYEPESGICPTEASGPDVPTLYYNLQGIPVARPSSGAIVIKVEGDKASKVIIR